MDGYNDSSRVPCTQGTGIPAPETQRASEPTTPSLSGLYRYCMQVIDGSKDGRSRVQNRGNGLLYCSVDFASDILWSWAGDGGE